MSRLYPISMNIAGKTCLVIGGGAVAERKVRSLLECGGRVVVVSPGATGGLESLAKNGDIELLEKVYQEFSLEGLSPTPVLIFTATNDRETNLRVFQDAERLGIAVNTVDDPELCTFYVPSVLRRGPLSVAVSTEGKSPLMARMLREQFEEVIGPEYEEYLNLLGECRERVLQSKLDESKRRMVFKRLIELDLLEDLRRGNKELAKERAEQCLSSWSV
ncbi:MAG: bifunctional precorrin-2 dehydrogenase/sirohydrochlorin ferrochelatase [Firmicutes bacterium]|nr:bifunctional precorrin-2 dehydrogenase/sirohydrochlorin ferrochelatase [Bacillota bacterium]